MAKIKKVPYKRYKGKVKKAGGKEVATRKQYHKIQQRVGNLYSPEARGLRKARAKKRKIENIMTGRKKKR